MAPGQILFLIKGSIKGSVLSRHEVFPGHRNDSTLITQSAANDLLDTSVMNINTGSYSHISSYLQASSPRTSPMEYMPASLPARNTAASAAPLAKTALL